jgi:transcription initiation factor TFIIE subunit alpha
MEIAFTLIRSVVRSFFSKKDSACVIIIEALHRHSVLRADELALLMGEASQKTVQALCGPLRESGLISVHTREEVRQGEQRDNKGSQREFKQKRDYYYINLHTAIDSIKFKVKKLQLIAKERYSQDMDAKKPWFCTQCKAEWTELDVMNHMDMRTYQFLCNTCDHPLQMHDAETTDAGNDKLSRLNTQLGYFLGLLRQIDETKIPENNFSTALANAVPIPRNEAINPAARTEVVGRSAGMRPEAVRGQQAERESIVVTVGEESQESKDIEAARQKKLAEQNVLPVWHSVSTVTGEQTGVGAPVAAVASLAPAEETKEPVEGVDSEAVKAYYAAVAAEQAAAEPEEEEEGDSDDDEMEFEEVAVPGATTSEAPAQKKVKIQEEAIVAPVAVAAAADVGTPAESDEDEFEFENVI